MTSGERIRKLRKEKGLTQEELGNLLGVQKSAIAKYENNRVPNIKKDKLFKLAEIFGVSTNYLLCISEIDPIHTSPSIEVPLFNNVSCGTGLFVDDNIDEYLSIPETLLNPLKDYFCQYADGDSMIEENINTGDLVIFEKTQSLSNGDIGCFTIDDNVATCKKFYRDAQNNCFILQPANPDYAPIIVNEGNSQGFRIIGKLSLVISKR